MKTLLPPLQLIVNELKTTDIDADRRTVLQELISYVQSVIDQGKTVNLNYICTHNSRRSQFSQLWSQVAAFVFGIPANSFSGGVEITACNERAIASMRRFGFEIFDNGGTNPNFEVTYATGIDPVILFSKLFDDASSPANNFAAIMTCAHADENCPYIPGADARIPVRYEDPKAFDDTDKEELMYDERSRQIASEMLYVFSQIKITA